MRLREATTTVGGASVSEEFKVIKGTVIAVIASLKGQRKRSALQT